MCMITEDHRAAQLCNAARTAGQEACDKGLAVGAIVHAMELAMEDNGEIVSLAMHGALEHEAALMVRAREANRANAA
jgi:hypothetical protein